MKIQDQSGNIKNLYLETKKLASDSDGLTVSDKQTLFDKALANDGKLDDTEKEFLLSLENKSNVDAVKNSNYKFKGIEFNPKADNIFFPLKTNFDITAKNGKPLDLKTNDIKDLNGVLKFAKDNNVPEKEIFEVISSQMSGDKPSMKNALMAAYTYTTLKTDQVKNMGEISVNNRTFAFDTQDKPNVHNAPNGMSIKGEDYALIAEKIKSGKITFKFDKAKGIDGHYAKDKNQFIFSDKVLESFKKGNGKDSNLAKALIVHESTHAVFDAKGVESFKINEEALGYLAQTKYLRSITGQEKINIAEYNNPNLFDKDKFTTMENVSITAADYLDSPSDRNLEVLLANINKVNAYTLDKENAFDRFTNDGI